ncbi:autotransporter outer membrane beta-barrel domain-containing protein [Alphaproteobacteria bacterium]|nr:autotransporter outer membrane beta-barrel domain-containing protein [Alphaproteobacteria bacterium]
MKLINRLVMLGCMTISVLALNSKAFAAAGDYGLSCTNDAYGAQLGNIYQSSGNFHTSQSVGGYGVYVGTDCVYAGGGRTNSSAIVGGEIARAAANSIIGAVNGRLSSALSNNGDTAAHMSYTSNGGGVGMAANHIVGGISIWTNFSSSDFSNDQTFTQVAFDSNNFDGDSSAMTVGIDKQFGNVIAGFAVTGFDTDIDTAVNKGNVTAEGETYGVYVGLKTGVVTLSIGAGTGEFDIDSRREDLGSAATITAKDITADVQYYHVNVSGTLNRGKLSFSPRVGYRNFDMDMPAFTDIVPDDTNTIATDTLTTTDESVGGKTYSSDMTEAGLSIALSTGGKITPYIDAAYVKEDTTSASYTTELTADGTSDLAVSAPDGYISYGGGVMLDLSGKVSGYLNFTETTNRTDFSETSISGSLKVKF